MKTEEKPACPFCSQADASLIYRDVLAAGRKYNVYRCAQCGLGMTSPHPDPQELARLYATGSYRQNDSRFLAPLEYAIRRFRTRRLNTVERFSRSTGQRAMLDVGCARGIMLSEAGQRGWNVHGLEFDDNTASHARDTLGMDVRTGPIEAAGFNAGMFDAVTFWHVLEHLPAPARALDESSRILKQGGLLVVSVPNFDSIQSALGRQAWFHLDLPYHLYHFSRASIVKALDQSGFRLVHEDNYSLEFNPFGFLQSILNRAGFRHNLLYDLLKKKGLGSDWTSAPAQTIATGALLPILGPASFVLATLESLAGRGGTVDYFAIKE